MQGEGDRDSGGGVVPDMSIHVWFIKPNRTTLPAVNRHLPLHRGGFWCAAHAACRGTELDAIQSRRKEVAKATEGHPWDGGTKKSNPVERKQRTAPCRGTGQAAIQLRRTKVPNGTRGTGLWNSPISPKGSNEGLCLRCMGDLSSMQMSY